MLKNRSKANKRRTRRERNEARAAVVAYHANLRPKKSKRKTHPNKEAVMARRAAQRKMVEQQRTHDMLERGLPPVLEGGAAVAHGTRQTARLEG